MDFRDTVGADISAIIMNTAEFAENLTVKYDGEIYCDIPIVLQDVGQSAVKNDRYGRVIGRSNRVEGLFLAEKVAYINAADLNGVIPEQGQYFEIEDGEALGEYFFRRFTIVTSQCNMGLIKLELRVFDE